MTSQRPTVLITGGTRGIGRATCAALGADHHVLVGGRDRELAEEVASSLPSAEPWICDLTDTADLRRAVSEVRELDVVIHSAGIEAMGTILESTAEQWRGAFELNVVSVVELTKALLPQLRERRGMVLAVNSGSGLTSRAGAGAYCASKFALTAFTDALREEEAGRVRVVSVHPGRVDTEMQERIVERQGGHYRAEEYLRAEDVASVIASAVRLPDGASIGSVTVRPDSA
ncbi:SDR family oxidoreductase [uncultured Agrococcus sp.]|uniref:SDR family oxidoreductase n=1 Tax=uncultured Agrococcus sp. TaxID=382258 RepID=UPI0025E762D4|nr:SDR family oxidoreductase [uncultured Agrococcus sp.]